MAFNMTTLILIRHAERVNGGDDLTAPLTHPFGEDRAQALKRILGKASIRVIYVSDALRTQQTAKPLADLLHITPKRLTAAADLKQDILTNSLGATILVVGHSNTTHDLIDLLGGGAFTIGEAEFDKMFVLTLITSTDPGSLTHSPPGTARTIEMRYGDKSHPDH